MPSAPMVRSSRYASTVPGNVPAHYPAPATIPPRHALRVNRQETATLQRQAPSMRTLPAVCAALIALSSTPAFAWGETGHRVVGQIADAHLSSKARAAVKRILGTETMAEASNWPDFMKSDPSPRAVQRHAAGSQSLTRRQAHGAPLRHPHLRRFGSATPQRKRHRSRRQ